MRRLNVHISITVGDYYTPIKVIDLLKDALGSNNIKLYYKNEELPHETSIIRGSQYITNVDISLEDLNEVDIQSMDEDCKPPSEIPEVIETDENNPSRHDQNLEETKIENGNSAKKKGFESIEEPNDTTKQGTPISD